MSDLGTSHSALPGNFASAAAPDASMSIVGHPPPFAPTAHNDGPPSTSTASVATQLQQRIDSEIRQHEVYEARMEDIERDISVLVATTVQQRRRRVKDVDPLLVQTEQVKARTAAILLELRDVDESLATAEAKANKLRKCQEAHEWESIVRFVPKRSGAYGDTIEALCDQYSAAARIVPPPTSVPAVPMKSADSVRQLVSVTPTTIGAPAMSAKPSSQRRLNEGGPRGGAVLGSKEGIKNESSGGPRIVTPTTSDAVGHDASERRIGNTSRLPPSDRVAVGGGAGGKGIAASGSSQSRPAKPSSGTMEGAVSPIQQSFAMVSNSASDPRASLNSSLTLMPTAARCPLRPLAPPRDPTGDDEGAVADSLLWPPNDIADATRLLECASKRVERKERLAHSGSAPLVVVGAGADDEEGMDVKDVTEVMYETRMMQLEARAPRAATLAPSILVPLPSPPACDQRTKPRRSARSVSPDVPRFASHTIPIMQRPAHGADCSVPRPPWELLPVTDLAYRQLAELPYEQQVAPCCNGQVDDEAPRTAAPSYERARATTAVVQERELEAMAVGTMAQRRAQLTSDNAQLRANYFRTVTRLSQDAAHSSTRVGSAVLPQDVDLVGRKMENQRSGSGSLDRLQRRTEEQPMQQQPGVLTRSTDGAAGTHRRVEEAARRCIQTTIRGVREHSFPLGVLHVGPRDGPQRSTTA